MKNAVVTGGAGFIGSHIAQALVQKGYQVSVIDNFCGGKEENLQEVKNNITLIKADVTNTNVLTSKFAGADVIFHLAAIPSIPLSIENPRQAHEANATGVLTTLIAAKQAGVKRVVFSSTCAVYGDHPELPKKETSQTKPISPYAAQKLLGEFYCRHFFEVHGIETVSLRYFNVFGPRQDPTSAYAAAIPKFITKMLKGEKPTIFGNGLQTRDFAYVENIVNANLLAMESKNASGETINIATGTTVNLLEVVDQINKILGTNIKPMHESARKGDIIHSSADITKAKKVLGFTPKVSLSEGLRKTIEWMKEK